MRRHLLALFCASFAFGGLAVDAQAAASKERASTKGAASAAAPAKKVKRAPVQRGYTKRVSTESPLFVAFVRDESGTNRHPIAGTDTEMSKAEANADGINRNLTALV
jgi:hypothetical protein